MKSYDYEAVVYDSVELCVECLPEGVNVNDESVAPIFADQEWDRTVVCDKCGAEHDYMTVLGRPGDDDGKEPGDKPVNVVLDEAFYESDNAHEFVTDSLAKILDALETRYGETDLIRAIAEYWMRTPELFVARLREAGMEVA